MAAKFLLAIRTKKALLDFWRWAYSDLIGNTERGSIAEYLVAMACNLDYSVRISWDSYDLTINDDIKIEVKSSAFLQSLKQKKLSIPVFNVPKTKSWDYINNVYGTEKKRHADVYVFALLNHLEKSSLNPLDTKQWEFYIINTDILNQVIKDSKQITLKKLIEINSIKCTYDGLHQSILKSARR